MFEFEWFKAQKTLALNNNSDIKRFYATRYNADYPVFYHCLPEYNSAIGSTQFKYAVIEHSGDEVFIAYKIIQIMTTNQVRIFDRPISYNGSTANENWLIEKLKELPFIKFVFKENTDGLQADEECVEYNDYFIDFSEHKIKQKYVNRFDHNENLTIEVTNDLSADEKKKALELRKLWTDKKNASKLSLKEFANLLCAYSSNFYFILIYYRDELISVKVIIVTTFGYANSIYNFGNDDVACDKQTHDIIEYKLRDAQNKRIKDILAMFNMSKLYIAGCRPTEHRLIKHKEEISDGKIRYFLDNANYTVAQPKLRKTLF